MRENWGVESKKRKKKECNNGDVEAPLSWLGTSLADRGFRDKKRLSLESVSFLSGYCLACTTNVSSLCVT